MYLIRSVNDIIIGLAFSFSILPRIAFCEEPSIAGEFPFEFVASIHSGPFTSVDKDDLLVLHRGGGIQFLNYGYTREGIGMGTFNLALYSFDGTNFSMIREDRSVMLEYSLPLKCPISRTTWCYGDFNSDGRCSIVTCNVNRMWEYSFEENHFEQYNKPIFKLIKTPGVWIDHLMACDIDDDGRDELVALEYLNLQDNSGKYQVGIYKIIDGTLIEVWRGLEGKVGLNFESIPTPRFISTCRIERIPGEVPVIMGSQSDVSLSHYSVIGKTETGDYDIMLPFPIPQQAHLRKGERGARAGKERPSKSNVGPVGGVILNDGDKVFSYGLFINQNEYLADAFGLLEGDHWRLVEKTDPEAGGELCKFIIDTGRSGWLFIKNGKFRFYDKLPVVY